ncbi:LuxR family transcriptional regulator [Phytoactinopolyspora halotolerans]|uniref:LuxR family transcriptional regulator n=1 Tax=Phytoactinopolyspora halotolerans TaxID=1981512 RepID=A0A6L9S505_9ACTN|nr:LuxR family transcriptional regulator [Phytoactinopolyspora halotolerans]NED99723.1 LuxR family transcriptional regulator [Phytoactinopolyspora halotolerans]
MNELLSRAHAAYQRHDWQRAEELFDEARARGGLGADDLHAVADASWWLGHLDRSLETAAEAYRCYLDDTQPRRAAMEALGIAYLHALRGDEAEASGWMSRAAGLLSGEPDCPEQAYLAYLVDVEGGLDRWELDSVLTAADVVRESGRRHSDTTLVALGLTGRGHALIRQGRVADGMAALDDAMTTSLHDGLSPDWVGNVYCHLMSACHEVADVPRARHWTAAASRWVDSFSAAVLFAGICRVHRAQILQEAGAWEEAEREAARVCTDVEHLAVGTAAEAHYQVGEVRRLRGDYDGALAEYQRARELGRDPQPGSALVRLAQGQADAASSSIRAALLAETGDRLVRARLLAAQVEIALSAGDIETARAASAELSETAARYGSAGLNALARQAEGLVSLADGGAEEALPILRDACRLWRELDAPYECARVRLVLAQAYMALGDDDAAAAEQSVAADVFKRLGAAPDSPKPPRWGVGPPLPDGLTRREVEVLGLVAHGRTNRQIATSLTLSEKTVARHLSNIFAKTGVSSRTEAAAYAFQHRLAP